MPYGCINISNQILAADKREAANVKVTCKIDGDCMKGMHVYASYKRDQIKLSSFTAPFKLPATRIISERKTGIPDDG